MTFWSLWGMEKIKDEKKVIKLFTINKQKSYEFMMKNKLITNYVAF